MVKSLRIALGLLLALSVARPSAAGGGGQNVLLLVNPNEESALRLANAYAAERHIPVNNIVFIEPPSDAQGYTSIETTWSNFQVTYLNTLPGIISHRGLDGQIDYIVTVGQSHSIRDTIQLFGGPHTQQVSISTNYALSQLTQFGRGMTMDQAYSRFGELYEDNVASMASDYTAGTNQAIRHADEHAAWTHPNHSLPPGMDTVQWYMSGNVGYTGKNATITTRQMIDNLRRTVAADGTKPEGTIYFEHSGDTRSGLRRSQWPGVQAYMTNHDIAWMENFGTPGSTPKDRDDVAGAVIGDSTFIAPNGSTYLAGSWADNLTSFGSAYWTPSQTKASRLLAAGAAGSSGTIAEPGGSPVRFPAPSIFVYSRDGSTLGEAFFKSVQRPDMQMFEGDLLSQAWADVPLVGFTSAPAPGSQVSGTLAIGAEAVLVSPDLATDIARLELYVDSRLHGTITAGSGSFDLDTTTLSDGLHELRVVAINNAEAQSQGYTLSHVLVNNQGQSVSTSDHSFEAAWNDVLNIDVSAAAGSGTIAQIELRSLGRTVSTASGDIFNLDVTKLAYGLNTLVPVAVFSDGTEVAGLPVQVNRDFNNKLAGHTPTPVEQRVAGFTMEFFEGVGGLTLSETDFSGQADLTLHAMTAAVADHIPDAYRTTTGGSNVGLGVRISANFVVDEEGEYGFAFGDLVGQWTSVWFFIDGQLLTGYDRWDGEQKFLTGAASKSDTLREVYLLPGEHEYTVLLVNGLTSELNDNQLRFSGLTWRDLDGMNHRVDSQFFYVPIPEPASVAMLTIVGLAMLHRQRDDVPTNQARGT